MIQSDSDNGMNYIKETATNNKATDVMFQHELPPNRKPINSRWVFKIKRNADGTVECYKARLVVKGYAQISGIDYDETFAPVTRYDSLRLIIVIAAKSNSLLQQTDIKSAFLYGELDEEIWMNPPPGIGLDGKVLHLRKALNG